MCERRSDALICNACLEIHPIVGPLCNVCGQQLSEPMDMCGECLVKKDLFLTRIRSCYWLDERAREILHLAKYRGKEALLKIVFGKNEAAVLHEFPSDAVIVPVPLHFSSHWQRGFNQSERLALFLASMKGLPLERGGLAKIVKTPPQSTLSGRERRSNLRSSFAWKGERNIPKKIILVDDVYTTGSTFDACARVLRKKGCEEVYGWTLFRTPRNLP